MRGSETASGEDSVTFRVDGQTPQVAVREESGFAQVFGDRRVGGTGTAVVDIAAPRKPRE